jgi:hypothetical protein
MWPLKEKEVGRSMKKYSIYDNVVSGDFIFDRV